MKTDNFKIRKVDKRGFYIVDRLDGQNYLHKDGLMYNGIQDAKSGFWKSKKKARKALDKFILAGKKIMIVTFMGTKINLSDVSCYGGCAETLTTPADPAEISFSIDTGSSIFDDFLENNFREAIEELAFEGAIQAIKDNQDNIADMRYQQRKEEGVEG